MQPGFTIEVLPALFSAPHRQSPDSNSLFFDDHGHQSRRLDRFLNDRHLVLVQLEVDNLSRFGFPSREFLLQLLLEVFLRQVTGFMQPGSTIEVPPVPPGKFYQFDPLRPAHFLQLLSRL